ncbi:DUF6266 family protein [Plebeiibacterium sediminum]|uniref:DUF6266 family protein n=1 Tax=Plebeiibacterium sediminum TaxID=2992112 RepID=A0AAE3M704_9BACT|nr:DUF6266 family protein [Plebeiobacterium sediminum]MCW3788273.1 DUF6266 family protein [Plebeiobacterium sediminum]
MARLNNGILGGGSGKVGTVVMYTRYGREFVRSLPTPTKDKKTPGQLAQRQKMALIHQFLRPEKELIQKTFANDSSTRSPYQSAQSYNLKHAIAGEYPDQYIDLQKGLISKGNIPLPAEITYVANKDGIRINWNTGIKEPNAEDYDTLMIVWKYKQSDFIDYTTVGARRYNGTFLWTEITGEELKDYTIWLIFRNREETDYSNSYCLHIADK